MRRRIKLVVRNRLIIFLKTRAISAAQMYFLADLMSSTGMQLTSSRKMRPWAPIQLKMGNVTIKWIVCWTLLFLSYSTKVYGRVCACSRTSFQLFVLFWQTWSLMNLNFPFCFSLTAQFIYSCCEFVAFDDSILSKHRKRKQAKMLIIMQTGWTTTIQMQRGLLISLRALMKQRRITASVNTVWMNRAISVFLLLKFIVWMLFLVLLIFYYGSM